jgi:sarcosine oxidase gamma subunit
MLERRSALAGALAKGGAGGDRRLALGEVRGWSLVQVAAFASTLPELGAAVQPLLGAALPTRIGESAAAGPRRLFKTGPEQFWIVGPEADDLASPLTAAVAPAVGAVTPLSHSRTRIFVEGPAVRDLLANRYELYVLRTFALSVWDWLTDAALPFGYEVVA